MCAAKKIMVQGTGSSVGKSLICAGLCRIFKQDGYAVSPYKSQNMALNSFITSEGKEMGRAQVYQAEAAGVEPCVDMNPILIKPNSDTGAQIILNGEVHGNMDAVGYDAFKPELSGIIKAAYERLAARNDIIVMEGAGSPAEINLRDRDIVNMGMAGLVDAPVILVGDIDKGGVFAQLAGTMLLLSEEEKKRVKGVIINKFRGDIALLKPGLSMLEDIIKRPVLGVVPFFRHNIEDEDGFLDERFRHTRREPGTEIDIAVTRLPHISNYTDFLALENIPGTKVRYIDSAKQFDNPDMLVVPGTKSTINDLGFLRANSLDRAIIRYAGTGGVVFGICGGYQMLGKIINDPLHVESAQETVEGLGLLDISTVFRENKTKTQVRASITDCYGLLEGLKGASVEGYEIHMGGSETVPGEGCTPFLEILETFGRQESRKDGVRNREGNVFGSYIHGIFDNYDFSVGFINNLRRSKGLPEAAVPPVSYRRSRDAEYDLLAGHLRKHLDIGEIYRAMY